MDRELEGPSLFLLPGQNGFFVFQFFGQLLDRFSLEHFKEPGFDLFVGGMQGTGIDIGALVQPQDASCDGGFILHDFKHAENRPGFGFLACKKPSTGPRD